MPWYLPDLLRLHAGTDPDVVAINVDGDASLTYAVWERRSDTAAATLQRLGAGCGTRIGLLFTGMDWISYAIAYLAILKAGATAVHLGTALQPAEQLRRLTECGVTTLVCGHTTDPPPGYTGGTLTPADLQAGGASPARVPIQPDHTADILYTSGTTGNAKALLNPHALLSLPEPPPSRNRAAAPMLCPLPLGSNSSASTVTAAILNPTSLTVVSPYDDIHRTADLAADLAADQVMMTPWTAIRLAATNLTDHDLSRVQRFLLASSPLPTTVATRLLSLAPGAALYSVYTQSEAVPAVLWHEFTPQQPYALGRPRGPKTRVVVADERGRAVPAGTVGEIWLHAPGPGRRYLDPSRNPGKYRDGWTCTGDLGWLDPEGVLHLFDRAEHAIRTGGRRISSVAIEEVLYQHPAVREAAVVGLPGPAGDQYPAAFLVLDTLVRADAIRSWLAGRLDPLHLPARLHLVDSLPRGLTGKVLKYRLHAAYAGGSSSPAPVSGSPAAGSAASQPPGAARPPGAPAR